MLQAELHRLILNEPFRIAHGTSSERQVIRLREGKAVAEAPFVPYYGDSPEETLGVLQALESPLQTLPADAPRAARLVLDLLRQDLAAKAAGMPLWKHLNLPDPNGQLGCRSFSIPVDLDHFRERVAETALQFKVLKLKLGSGNTDFDEAIVAYAREAAPRALLLADANGGWSPREAAKVLPRLDKHELTLVEQPVTHADALEPWRELESHLVRHFMPLVADESAQTADDVAALEPYVDGINVKMLKCGSFAGARQMIATAREHGLKVLLGCMIESSLGTAAAAHLAGSVDLIDLDGHLYVANDDFAGLLRYDAGGTLRLK
ncbi:MAG: Mandelate racemase/muconate lactonizing protein [Verrucomicrobiaceae bacterium]|nr:Mandelate racemase/muconate lactonizing protein [Verrucomicrobiaceae bacterium]